jgi:hypothetical protein
VHEGDESGGHYICYFKNGPYWYLFNDSGASITKIENLDKEYIESRWTFLVYFRNQIPTYKVDFISSLPILSNAKSFAKSVGKKYGLDVLSIGMLSSIVVYLLSIENSQNFDVKYEDFIWLISGLSIIIFFLVSSNEPIDVTVRNFFKNLTSSSDSTHSGGYLNIPNNWIDLKNYIIEQVTFILTEWYNTTDRSKKSLEGIIEKFKINNYSIEPQLELAQLVKTPEYTLTIIKSNKSGLSKLNVSQQIMLLRSLRWKVNMTSVGPVLIDWNQWIKLLAPKEQIIINQIVDSNPWIKSNIQSYIYNINLNHSNLLNK